MTKKANNNVYEIIMNSPYRDEELRKFVPRDAKVYEVVGTLIDGAELRRYTFYDSSVYSVIFSNGCLVDFVPIEKEYDLVAWWETEWERQQYEEADNGSKTDDI